jgi:hypothetical protein
MEKAEEWIRTCYETTSQTKAPDNWADGEYWAKRVCSLFDFHHLLTTLTSTGQQKFAFTGLVRVLCTLPPRCRGVKTSLVTCMRKRQGGTAAHWFG